MLTSSQPDDFLPGGFTLKPAIVPHLFDCQPRTRKLKESSRRSPSKRKQPLSTVSVRTGTDMKEELRH